jgi:natural product biosynthesis luciferase-like monooxygenase protein
MTSPARPRLAVMFFASHAGSASGGYDQVLRACAAADRLGYAAVWFPERHFSPFGGLFPNPAVLGAAVATTTRSVRIRGGSVVAPLHDVLRIAEEWAVVDGLSGGRAEVSLGSGWNAADFVLAPQLYEDRARITRERVAELRHLWRGQPCVRTVGGREIEVVTYPRPRQAELPLWLTASGNPETFRVAGRLGLNVLTHLLGQRLTDLDSKIQIYQRERAENGFPPGVVSVMAHSFVADSDAAARRAVRGPLGAYLRDAAALELRASAAGGTVSGGRALRADTVPAAMLDQVVAERLDRICRGDSLIGSPDRCAAVLERLAGIGVGEVAALVDFGLPTEAVLDGLDRLAALRGLDGSTAPGGGEGPRD